MLGVITTSTRWGFSNTRNLSRSEKTRSPASTLARKWLKRLLTCKSSKTSRPWTQLGARLSTSATPSVVVSARDCRKFISTELRAARTSSGAKPSVTILARAPTMAWNAFCGAAASVALTLASPMRTIGCLKSVRKNTQSPLVSSQLYYAERRVNGHSFRT
eukprot:scaffold345369_cov38-Prasinocladus_malaysianus.AAC.2